MYAFSMFVRSTMFLLPTHSDEEPLFPVVEAAARDADSFAEQPNGELTGKFHDYLVLSSCR